MKIKSRIAIGLGVLSVVCALAAPGINAAAHPDPSGQLTPTVTTPSAVAGRVSPGGPDTSGGDPMLGTVTDAEKGAPGVPEVVVPAKKQTLAEVRAELRRQQCRSGDRTTTHTAFQKPDGTILVTTIHIRPAPGAKLSPQPAGGCDGVEGAR